MLVSLALLHREEVKLMQLLSISDESESRST